MGDVKKQSIIRILAIYSLIFLSNGTLLMSPTMDTMVVAFPHEEYSKVLLTYTLPSFVALPFTLISGNIVGSRLRYRTMLLVVVPIYLVTGVAPLFLNSLDGVLVCRALFGVCLGMIAPQGNALILRTFSAEERYRYLGYGSVVVGIAGVVFQMLGGYLCSFGWRYAFLGYLVALVPLGLILFGLAEPERVERELKAAKTAAAADQAGQHHMFRKGVVPLFLLVAFLYIGSQTKMLTISSIVASEGLGDSKTSAAVLSVATVGAMLGGVGFPLYCKAVKRYRIPVLIFVLALTTATNLVNSVLVISVGYAIGTMAFMMNLNLMILRASEIYGAENSSKATGLIQFGEKCGVFLATYFTTVLATVPGLLNLPISQYKMPVIGSMAIYLLAAFIDAKLNGPEMAQSDTK